VKAHRRLPFFYCYCALIAAMLGAPLVAGGALAVAKPVEPQENSLHSAVDSFVSHLKSETNEAVTAAARIARENKDTVAEVKSRIGAQIAAFSAALSGQKARLTTLGKDASAYGGVERGGRLVLGKGAGASSRRS
jgi:hypothetical protein